MERRTKLALWNTRNMRPVLTHDHLHRILSTLGFVPTNVIHEKNKNDDEEDRSGSTTTMWIEYSHHDGAMAWPDQPPRPCLPYPRIDGLHISTYEAFLGAVNFYLHRHNICDVFHIRGMPLRRVHDGDKKWLRMTPYGRFFVYRDGISVQPDDYGTAERKLSQAEYEFYFLDNEMKIASNLIGSTTRQEENSPTGHDQNDSCMAVLKDIIVDSPLLDPQGVSDGA